MEQLTELEKSIYYEYIKIKPEKLKRVEEIRDRDKARFIQFCFPSGADYIYNSLIYDKTLNRFVFIEYPIYNGDDIEFKKIEL